MYFLNSTAHRSDGSAPTLIQYLMRSGFRVDALVGVLDHRIVGAQFLDDPAVARLAGVDGHDAEITAGASGPSFSCECELPRGLQSFEL